MKICLVFVLRGTTNSGSVARLTFLPYFVPRTKMRLILFTTFLATLVVATDFSNQDPDPNLPSSGGDQHSPPVWTNPAWGSQGGGSTGWTHNSSFGALPATFQPQVWGSPGPFYGANQNIPMNGPLGMYYPQNWQVGGYAYPPQHPAYAAPPPFDNGITANPMVRNKQMAVDNDNNENLNNSHQTGSSNAPPVITTAQRAPDLHPERVKDKSERKKKGKKKASVEEIQQQLEEERSHRADGIQQEVQQDSIPSEVLDIARRIHERNRLGDLEDHLRQAHESLARALERSQRLERDLEQTERGTKRPRGGQSSESNGEHSNK